MALAWECKIEFVCLGLAPNAWELRALSQLNTLNCFFYLPIN